VTDQKNLEVDDRKLVRVLRALADKGRFRMVQEIAAAGELSCGQVGERFNLTQPTISHHLKILADAEVLVVRREGQHAIVSVNQELLDEAARLLPRRLQTKPRAPAVRNRHKGAEGPA
jgi:ArsR family transcriptional regulator